MNRLLPLAALLAVALPATSRAADSFDACAFTITSLPATLSSQGTYCLTGNLATGMTSGAAITVAANNVTIDCNGFKLGGLAAGPTSTTTGIQSTNRQNTTVRNCGIRGFIVGVGIEGTGAGHLVEDNRIDGSLLAGIYVDGEGAVVQRNRVADTGPGPFPTRVAGIVAAGGSVDILENTVFGVEAPDAIDAHAYGILAEDIAYGRIAGNSVRHLAATPGDEIGIAAIDVGDVVIDDNHVASFGGDVGIDCGVTGDVLVRDNFVQSFDEALGAGCLDEGRNSASNSPL